MLVTPYLGLQTNTDFSLNFSNLKFSANILASTNTTLTIPSYSPRYMAVIKVEQNGIVWVAKNATAAAPAGSSFVSTSSELVTDAKSLCRELKAGDILNFFSIQEAQISVVLYSLASTNGI